MNTSANFIVFDFRRHALMNTSAILVFFDFRRHLLVFISLFFSVSTYNMLYTCIICYIIV